MDIIKAHAIKNLCYIKGEKMVPAGIVVHSTGANNPNLKRYVDCPQELGENRYSNHWNNPTPDGRKVCVHAFIGYDKNKHVRVAEILPLDICCWGVGSGSKGSYNFDPAYIQFEICEDNLNNKDYYLEAIEVAAKYCAHHCKKYGISVECIVGHQEAYKKGYGSNHSDPDHWMRRFGESMDDFRKKVAELLAEKPSVEEMLPVGGVLTDGALVEIASNAKYYNGAKIPLWVKEQRWYVKGDPRGDRAVIDQNEAKTTRICSPIRTEFLTVISKNEPKKKCPYLVKIPSNALSIHQEADVNSPKTGCITDKGTYTIVEEKIGTDGILWGKLKSDAGWISLNQVVER